MHTNIQPLTACRHAAIRSYEESSKQCCSNYGCTRTATGRIRKSKSKIVCSKVDLLHGVVANQLALNNQD
jgi:hypothetical protein